MPVNRQPSALTSSGFSSVLPTLSLIASRVYRALACRLDPPIRFSRPFPTFDDALAGCTGYDDSAILERVLSATLEVKHGRAEYERDSVLFDRVSYSEALLAGLLLAVSIRPSCLNVLDFGGSLGSSYFQNRKLLSSLAHVDWRVIEQPHFVDAGCALISTQQLSFFYPDQGLIDFQPGLLLFSCVLQYLSDPWAILSSYLDRLPDVLVLDRIPYLRNAASPEVRIQYVSSRIYKASYPCRFFSEDEMLTFILRRGYRLVDCFPCLDRLASFADWKGHVFARACS